MKRHRSGRVLFVTAQVPFPLDSGGKIRTFYQLRALAERFEVELVALGPDLDATQAADPLWLQLRGTLVGMQCFARDGITRIGALNAALRSVVLGRLPYPVEKYRCPAAATWIAQRTGAGSFDVVHFDFLYTFPLVDHVEGSARLVLDDHNVEALIVERMVEVELNALKRYLLQSQARMMARFECIAARRADRVLLCSPQDRDLLAARAGRKEGLEVVPNGVDPERFDPVGPTIEAARPYAMLLGSMDWWPNQDAVRWLIQRIWPEVSRQMPGLDLKIVGINPPPGIVALGGQRGVEVVGGVADVRPWMRGCAVFVVPLRVGGGTRLKIVEAMSIGAPIVSTAIGCEGLGVEHGRELIVADEAQDFAQAVIQVCSDRDLAARLMARSREAVLARFSWAAIGDRLGAIYEALLDGRPRDDGATVTGPQLNSCGDLTHRTSAPQTQATRPSRA